MWFQHAKGWFLYAEYDIDSYDSDYETHTC
jgi:hypothetical protein